MVVQAYEANRRSLLQLYKQLLRGAETFPSIKRDTLYQTIREEWRDNKTLTDDYKIQLEISRGIKGVSQLKQYEKSSLTGGDPDSFHWSLTLEQNPMPKPDDYDRRKEQERRLKPVKHWTDERMQKFMQEADEEAASTKPKLKKKSPEFRPFRNNNNK